MLMRNRLWIPLASLTLMVRAALAEPIPLSDDDLRRTAAGFLDTYVILSLVVVNNNTEATAVNIGNGSATASAVSNISVDNHITLNIATSDFLVTSNGSDSLAPSNSAPIHGVQFPTWIPWTKELRPFQLFSDFAARR